VRSAEPASSLRPSDIAGRRFAMNRKGYDPEEVDGFLRRVADEVGRLTGELEWHRARGEHLERRAEAAQEAAYSRMGRNFMDVVRALDEATARIRAEAEAAAKKRIAAAHDEADQIVAAAKEQANQVSGTGRGRSAARRRTGSPVVRVPDLDGDRALAASNRKARPR